MTTAKEVATKKRSKKYAEKAALIDANKTYSVEEAAELVTTISTVKFDATAEVHININADTSQADQLVRTTIALPHGTGKKVRIAAFVPDEEAEAAKKAGANLAGISTLLPDVEQEKLDFDVAIATPAVMKDLGKVAKILGQRGLMPNPKAGTVTQDIEKTIDELKKGRIEAKMDKQGIIHVPFGKVSFGGKKLQENLEAIIAAVKEAKPSGIKSEYIKSVSVSPSMGPSIKVAI